MFELQYFIIGIVQGFTEFLPISSSGHLVLISELTSWQDQGLFTDVALVAFYIITINGFTDFGLANPSLSLLLLLAGPISVIPLFLYVRGVELCGLGPSGMVFYITPTFQFILGYFYYNEVFSIIKLISFILIWVAVFVYLKDLSENN